jgi:hypothetical protein
MNSTFFKNKVSRCLASKLQILLKNDPACSKSLWRPEQGEVRRLVDSINQQRLLENPNAASLYLKDTGPVPTTVYPLRKEFCDALYGYERKALSGKA